MIKIIKFSTPKFSIFTYQNVVNMTLEPPQELKINFKKIQHDDGQLRV